MSCLVGAFDPLARQSSARCEIADEARLLLHCRPGLKLGVSAEPFRVESLKQLFCSRRGNAIAWDGRLDNRNELWGYLGKPADLAAATDAALALAVYEAGGEPALSRIVGDWSAAIWDCRSRIVMLASDFAGVRPLYYAEAGGILYWSSSLHNLVSWISPTELDDDYIAELLTSGATIGRTPYRGILAVPAGGLVRFSERGTVEARFWRLNPGRLIRFRDEAEYAEQLHCLFEEAVRVRMPAAAPVHSELSGGLDSSSIACMADRLITQGRVSTPRVVAVRYSHAGSEDEKFARVVIRSRQMESIQLDVGMYPYAQRQSAGESAPTWWVERHAELARRMHAVGSSVLLTGRMGDLVMGNWHDETDRLADLVRAGALISACKQAQAWSSVLNVPVLWILWRAIRLNLPFLPPPAGPVGALRRDASNSLSKRTHERALDLRRRRRGRWSESPAGHRRHFEMASEILESRALEVPGPLYPIFCTHPYVHRPLLEYMLAIPSEVACGIGEPRRLMRRAFASLLPPEVLHRRSKASFQFVFSDALRPLAAEILQDPRRALLVLRGYLEPDCFETRLRRFLNGLDCNEPQLRHVLLVEFWLRSHLALRRAGSSSPQRVGLRAV